MQLKKRPSRNRFRPLMEQLETRLVPAFTGSINFSPTSGNLSVIGTDNTAAFTATVSANNTVTITDGGGVLNNAFTGVTGNITINIGTTQTAAFVGTFDLGGQSVLGSLNLTFSRVSGGTAALTETVAATGGSVLGKTTLSATNSGDVTVNYNPAAASSLVGGLSVTTSNPSATTFNLNPAAASSVNGLTITANGGILGDGQQDAEPRRHRCRGFDRRRQRDRNESGHGQHRVRSRLRRDRPRQPQLDHTGTTLSPER